MTGTSVRTPLRESLSPPTGHHRRSGSHRQGFPHSRSPQICPRNHLFLLIRHRNTHRESILGHVHAKCRRHTEPSWLRMSLRIQASPAVRRQVTTEWTMCPLLRTRLKGSSSNTEKPAGSGAATPESLYEDTGALCDSTVSRRTDFAKAKAVVRNTIADHISRKLMTGRNKTFSRFCSIARDAPKAKEKAVPALADERIRKAKMAKS